jgi:catechol 2,3-dioxygenase-like lactoylglutathione lyase family enzyme
VNAPSRPNVDCRQHHPTLSVSDLHAATVFYEQKLGFVIAFTWGDPPTMAGVNLGQVQVFLELGTPCPKGCSIYFVVSDAEALYAFHRAAGVEILQEPGDREWDFRDYTVRDLDGYALTFGQRLAGSAPERNT